MQGTGKILTIWFFVMILLSGSIIVNPSLFGRKGITYTASGATITVDDDGGQDHQKIQDAIDAASSGDVINVLSGLYEETLSIVGKTITLNGAGMDKTIINGSGKGVICLSINTNYNNISGFSIHNGSIGILLNGTDGNRISQCNLTRNGFAGLALNRSENNIVENNYCNDNEWGIRINDSSRNVLMNNTCSSNGRDGINLTFSNNHVLSNNTCRSNDENGIFIGNSDWNTINNSDLQYNAWVRAAAGVKFFRSNNNSVKECQLSNNGRQDFFNSRGEGFHASESDDNLIKNNNISANWRFGLNIDRGSMRNRVSYNLATSNTQGVALLLMPGCMDNIIDNNTGLKNFQGIYVWGGTRNVIENNSMNTSVNFGLILYIDAAQNLVKQNNFSLNPSGGLLIFDATNNQLWNNSCFSNSVGIQLWDDSDNNVITENLLMNNTVSGIMILAAACQNNLIYHNTMIKNNGTGGIQGHDWGQNNVWDDGAGAGNFWSDYLNQRYNASHDGNVWNMTYEMGGKGGGNDRFSLAALPDPAIDTENPIFMEDNTTLKATTGDMFNLSINVSDDVGFRKVSGFYSYSDNEKLNLAYMKFYANDNWYRNIQMRENATGFSYYFEIEDYMGNSITTGEKDVIIIDNDPPELRNDTTHNAATTGDSFTFNAKITDNIGMDFVNVTYTYDHNTEYNFSMTEGLDDTWSRTITVEEGVENLDYYFFYGDVSDNTNNSQLERVIVRDNDLPFILKDNTGSLPTTGDPFAFAGNFSDNIEVSEVYVNYSINGIEFLPRSLVNDEDQRWTITIIIPTNGTNLSYHFHFMDNDGNAVTTLESSLEIVDNDLPDFMTDGTSEEATTGDELIFQTFVTDNIGISIVKVVYTYGISDTKNESMTNEGRGTPEMFSKTVTVDPGAILVDYHFYMEDESGNWNVTDTIVLFVSDNDRPVADAGDDRWIDQLTKVTFDGSGSYDNIELDEYEWSFGYDGKKTYIYGDDAKFTFITAGIYEVTLNVTDTSGNWKNDTMTVTVNDTTKPSAMAGNDHYGPIGTEIKFNASSSTDNVGIVEYGWGFKYNDSQINFTGEVGYFTFLIPGRYEVLLVVKDGMGNWNTDTVAVEIIDDTPPVADAGPDQTVAKGTTVRFNGTGSTDNARIENYTWSFEYNDTKWELYGISPEFRFDIPDSYSIKLRVTDAGGNSKSDTMELIVEKGAGGDDTEEPDDDLDPTDTDGGVQGVDFNLILIIAGIIVVLVVIFIIVFLVIRKRKGQKGEEKDEPLIDKERIDIPEGTGTAPAGDTAPEAPAVSSIPLREDGAPAPVECPICTGCGQPSKYYQEYNCYWCLGCQAYVYGEDSSEYAEDDSSLLEPQQLPSPEEHDELPITSMDGGKETTKALPEAPLDKVFDLGLDESVKAEKETVIPVTAVDASGTAEIETVKEPGGESAESEAEKRKEDEETPEKSDKSTQSEKTVAEDGTSDSEPPGTEKPKELVTEGTEIKVESVSVDDEKSLEAVEKTVQPEKAAAGEVDNVTTASDNGDTESEKKEVTAKDESIEEEKDGQNTETDNPEEDKSSEVKEEAVTKATASDENETDGTDAEGDKREQEELDSMLDDLLVGL